jgi:hypothetical protein
MTQQPPTCIFCGAGNTPYEGTEEIGPFIDTERDTGWGDPIYICLRDSCAGQIAMLAGWVSPDTKQDLENHVGALQRKLHDANSSLESAERHARGRRKAGATA